GDPCPLPRRDGRAADGVQEARLAMVDVAHDRHDRGTGDEVASIFLGEEDPLATPLPLGAWSDDLLLRGRLGGCALGDAALHRLEAELAGHQRGGVEVDRLVDGGEDPVADQLLDDVRMAHPQCVGQAGDAHRRGKLDRPAGADRDGPRLEGGGAARRTGPLARRPRPAPRHVSTRWHASPRRPAHRDQWRRSAPSSHHRPDDQVRDRLDRHTGTCRGPMPCQWDRPTLCRPYGARDGSSPAWDAVLGRRRSCAAAGGQDVVSASAGTSWLASPSSGALPCAAAAVATPASERMSMRHPVSFAARRAFCPSLPMASESWRSGTTTLAILCSSSIRTL